MGEMPITDPDFKISSIFVCLKESKHTSSQNTNIWKGFNLVQSVSLATESPQPK